MSETVDTSAAPEAAPAGPSLEEVAAQVFGGEAPSAPEPDKPVADAPPPAPEPPKPSPEDERTAQRIAAAKRAELRAAKERDAIASARAEVEAEKARLAEERKLVELVKAAKASPSKALELLGYAPKDFLETLATENEPGAIAAREVSVERAEREKLKAELDELRQSIQQEKHQAERQRVEALAKQAEDAFVAHVETNAAEYPHVVAEYTPEEVVREGHRILQEVVGHDDKGRPVTRAEAYRAEHGDYPGDKEIAEYLEFQAAKRAESRTAWRTRIGQSAPPETKPSEGATGEQKTAQTDRGHSPRTLTSRAASEKATAARPWSQEQADEESIRILSAALKAG